MLALHLWLVVVFVVNFTLRGEDDSHTRLPAEASHASRRTSTLFIGEYFELIKDYI